MGAIRVYHNNKSSHKTNKFKSLRRKFKHSSKYTAIGLVGFAAIAAFFVAIISPAKTNHAAPYLGCSTSGYIVRDSSGGGGHTDIQAIDMVTGAGSSAGPQIQNRQLNAIGYNPLDNHFYAWDLQNGVFVKISSDLATVTPFTPGNGMAGYAGTTNNIFSGDVDTDGHYWFFIGNTWHEADLTTGTPTLVGSGTPTNPTGTNGTDWAFVPGTNKLYRAMDEAGGIRIWSFDRTTKTYALAGTVPNITSPADGDMGSVYADPDGNFYMSSHTSGKLFRIDLSDAPNFTAAELDAVDPNSNDGARCALATVPTDFGDAPAGYDTAIDNDGPRHNVGNFDVFNSTAPLMLGHKIDLEEDGFPGADATGDDANHTGVSGFVDDERGVTHIAATPGNSDPLTVPAYVTNTTGQTATLVGWIDLDNDGSFEVGERVSASVPAGFIGYQQLTFPTPPAPYSTNTFARFRLFSANDTSVAAVNQLPTGPATGGEVEDVLVQVGSYDVNKTANPADGSNVDPGNTVTYTLTITNTGATALTSLKIDDDLTDVLDDATMEGAPAVNPGSAGTATVSGNTLEFNGDVGIGGTVTVTYAVKVKNAAALGNAALNNYLLAMHSTSCHPAVSSGSATVSDPDCQTNHNIGGLADTGTNAFTPLILSGVLLMTAGAVMWSFKLSHRRYRNKLR